MFRKLSFINNELVDIGVSVDIHDWLFGIGVSVNLPETLILVGVGPFNFYITIRGRQL